MQKKSTSRSTIGNNPLDSVIPHGLSQNREAQGLESDTRNRSEAPPANDSGASTLAKDSKERLTIHVPISLIERVKNAVFWTPGLTLADLGARALEEYVTQLESENGGPFEQRRHELKGGRPMR